LKKASLKVITNLFLYPKLLIVKFINQKIIMTKADIVAEIATQTGLEKTEVLRAVEAFMTSIKSSLTSGKNVYLRGFGSFVVKERAQKTGRNISKNTTIIIPAHNVPTFKASKTFVEQVKKELTIG
jgi:DNA-binding protein HU-beta